MISSIHTIATEGEKEILDELIVHVIFLEENAKNRELIQQKQICYRVLSFALFFLIFFINLM